MAHAALGFYSSPFANALVVVLDGRAEDAMGLNMYVAQRRTGVTRIFQRESRYFPSDS